MKREEHIIKGIGIDAVKLPRTTRLIEEKPKFTARILAFDEMKLFQSLPFHRQIEFLGGCYAHKETFSRAWGTGIGKVAFQDVEILKNGNGQPIVTHSPHEDNIWVSITHISETAFAQIVLEG